MKNWNLLLRRTHLYLGMLLLPWLLMYALSTVLFNHGDTFRPYRPADPQWLPWWEKSYAIEVPAGTDGLRATAARILADHGLTGAFGVQRQGQRLNINVQNFRQPLRLSYDPAQRILRAEKKKTSWVEVFIRLHQRAGYGQPGWLNQLWAVMVDVYCVTTLVWIATGLFLWWKRPSVRGWGFVAIGGGVGTLAILLGSL